MRLNDSGCPAMKKLIPILMERESMTPERIEALLAAIDSFGKYDLPISHFSVSYYGFTVVLDGVIRVETNFNSGTVNFSVSSGTEHIRAPEAFERVLMLAQAVKGNLKYLHARTIRKFLKGDFKKTIEEQLNWAIIQSMKNRCKTGAERGR